PPSFPAFVPGAVGTLDPGSARVPAELAPVSALLSGVFAFVTAAGVLGSSAAAVVATWSEHASSPSAAHRPGAQHFVSEKRLVRGGAARVVIDMAVAPRFMRESSRLGRENVASGVALQPESMSAPERDIGPLGRAAPIAWATARNPCSGAMTIPLPPEEALRARTLLAAWPLGELL